MAAVAEEDTAVSFAVVAKEHLRCRCLCLMMGNYDVRTEKLVVAEKFAKEKENSLSLQVSCFVEVTISHHQTVDSKVLSRPFQILIFLGVQNCLTNYFESCSQTVISFDNCYFSLSPDISRTSQVIADCCLLQYCSLHGALTKVVN